MPPVTTNSGGQSSHLGRTIATGVKAAADRISAALLLLLASPVILAIAVIVRVDSPGPAFYKQTRIGYRGQPFLIVKLRTMCVDAEQFQAQAWEAGVRQGQAHKCPLDQRLTGVGAFLRRWSLDELPQLVNVAMGSMSLVGPRPLQPAEVTTLSPNQRRRHEVPPGMTGLWQVSGRNETSWDERLRLDLEYVDSWSLTLDLRILVRTMSAVLRREGAY